MRALNASAFVGKISFYAKRLRKETVTKVVVLPVAVIALALQLVSGALPFTDTAAYASSSNINDNIVSQGVKNSSDLLAVYDRGSDSLGHKDIKQIYTAMGISRADIANAKLGSYNTNDFGGQLKTLGRMNWAGSGRSQMTVSGASTSIYTGPFLDGYNGKKYPMPALIGKRSLDGQWFAVTLDCGNIVYVVPPTPPKPKPQPMAACSAVTIQKKTRTSFDVAASATVFGGATVKGFHYVITKDGKTVTDRVVPTTGLGSQITTGSDVAGTYTVKVAVQTSLGDRTSDNCVKTFTVTPPPVAVKDIQVCDLKTGTIVTIKENQFDSSKQSKDLKDCDKLQVCDLTTKKIVTIKTGDFDSKKYSKDVTDCQTPIVVCDLATKTTVQIKEKDFDSNKYSKDVNDCKEVPPVTPPVTPQTPPELPHTGLGNATSAVLGLGSVIASIGYYAASRRNLLSALLNR